MFQSLRSQFIVPLCVTILISVALVAILAYYSAYHSARQLTEQRLSAVAAVATVANYPLTDNVLSQMRELSSLEIVIVQISNGSILSKTDGIATTETRISLPKFDAGNRRTLFLHDFRWSDRRWDLHARPLESTEQFSGLQIVVLSPHENQVATASQALYLPIATGSVAAIAVGGIATLLATRISNRIRKLGKHVSKIDLLDSEQFVVSGPLDEISKLTEDVNRMTQQLKFSQQTLAANQRSQLINQFASGMAHQFRNTLTGAQLAIQSHQQQFSKESSDDLDMALGQLRLAEQSIQSLLQVRTSPDQSFSRPQTIDSITSQLVGLIKSKLEHRKHELRIELDESLRSKSITDGQSVLGAVLNLALNGIDAMDKPGCLSITVRPQTRGENSLFCQFIIADMGEGPTPEIASTMMESFSTTKPEGIGIGLPMAMSIANRYGGTLTWDRKDGWTRFIFSIPVLTETA